MVEGKHNGYNLTQLAKGVILKQSKWGVCGGGRRGEPRNSCTVTSVQFCYSAASKFTEIL